MQLLPRVWLEVQSCHVQSVGETSMKAFLVNSSKNGRRRMRTLRDTLRTCWHKSDGDAVPFVGLHLSEHAVATLCSAVQPLAISALIGATFAGGNCHVRTTIPIIRGARGKMCATRPWTSTFLLVLDHRKGHPKQHRLNGRRWQQHRLIDTRQCRQGWIPDGQLLGRRV